MEEEPVGMHWSRFVAGTTNLFSSCLVGGMGTTNESFQTPCLRPRAGLCSGFCNHAFLTCQLDAWPADQRPFRHCSRPATRISETAQGDWAIRIKPQDALPAVCSRH